MKMSVEHWWNGTDGGKPKYWERNLSQCPVHHKYHMWIIFKDSVRTAL